MTTLSPEAPASRVRPAERHRVLLAPITVTPSKPLTPSHLKGLLWTDVMYRATRPLAEVTYRYSHTTYHATEQTLGFWEFLDRTHGDVDYSGLTVEQIGELYVAFRAADRAPAEALRPYDDAAERGWVHPASARVLQLWSGQYAALGLHDPGLLRHQPPGLTLEAMLSRLTALGMCLDQRDVGGPVYLDLTRHGLPLRQLVTPDGRPNYLCCALRELLPLAPDFDEVVLLYDGELDPDYQQLARVLAAQGPRVRRVSLGRVPVDGQIRSARHGGWRDLHAGPLLENALAEHDAAAVCLGMRLYFIAVLGPGQQQSFRADLLRQTLRRAARLLEAAPQHEVSPLAEHLARHRKDQLYVDPYRLTSGLLGRRRAAPALDLLATVFL
ncbi:hypothetical protein [Streptomyces monashensis]|uniref:Uncharacterized protein n=1 Tax=Streptomyces monashensis TaxID=1678012 RepID=A0A1S2QIN8_9ACTN|nr:hypothetical protein [Streptomyces monashensis]OIK06020.1 hypothetical protein BIV23_10030 [Streptomyces monashensis]